MTREKIFLINLALLTCSLFAQTDESSDSSAHEAVSQDEKPAIVNEEAPNSATPDAESEEERVPAPYPQASTKPSIEEKKFSEEKEKIPKRPPQKYGDCTGEFWIGQRVVTERHAGWGWLKRDGDSWRNAKWIMLEEKPGSIKAPQRFYPRPEDDNNMQYRLYGDFASYKGYEPNIDAVVDVFALKGFEVIGEGSKIDRRPPGPTGSRKGRISERERF